jgi:hypothetical protein
VFTLTVSISERAREGGNEPEVDGNITPEPEVDIITPEPEGGGVGAGEGGNSAFTPVLFMLELLA